MIKRLFDVFLAISLVIILLLPFLVILVITMIKTRSSGFFYQKRVGQYAEIFTIVKLQSINKDGRITNWGKFIRSSKFDEIPQLLNILKGDMSFVGARPDISGYYDKLEGENRKILELKPGLTSEASIKYANEEEILKKQTDPLQYNDNVIFPDKVKMNLEYYYNRSFLGDIKIIWKTIKKVF